MDKSLNIQFGFLKISIKNTLFSYIIINIKNKYYIYIHYLFVLFMYNIFN